jgi:hypothetical protein
LIFKLGEYSVSEQWNRLTAWLVSLIAVIKPQEQYKRQLD